MLQTLVQALKNVGQRVQELRGASMLNAKEKALDFSAASFAAHDETLNVIKAQKEVLDVMAERLDLAVKRIAELESRSGIRHG